MFDRHRIRTIILGLMLICSSPTMVHAAESEKEPLPSPPLQSTSGPGGASYAFTGVVKTRFGERPTGYWLFEPSKFQGETPVSTPMPLVIFLHGFSAVDPDLYGAWIEHIVKRGAVVVYPDYQSLNPTKLLPDEYLENALAGVGGAIAGTTDPNRTPIDQTRVAVVGHSVGGVLAANYAAVAAQNALPAPKVVLSVEPGGCRGCESMSAVLGVPIEDLSQVPATTRVIVLVGEDDQTVSPEGAMLFWEGMTNVPESQRDFVILRSDRHGSPELIADHFVPQTTWFGDGLNALDWFGTWKLFDLMTECGLFDRGCDQAFGNTPAQRFMGVWSDGVPVREPVITKSPRTMSVDA